MGSLWMGGRSELTRLASLLTTGPGDTGVVPLEAEASSAEDAAGAVGSLEVGETEAMEVAALIPGVEVMEAPETTMPAGVRVAAMVTGARAGPTETAMTVMVSLAPRTPPNGLRLGLVNPCALSNLGHSAWGTAPRTAAQDRAPGAWDPVPPPVRAEHKLQCLYTVRFCSQLHTTSKSPLRPDRPSMAVIKMGELR